jgi:hypothetical protein
MPSTKIRWLLLGGAALLAFAVGVARGMLEPPEAAPPRAPAAAAAVPEAAPPPAPAPIEAPAPAPLDLRREAVRARLEADLAAHFPELRLSSDEIDGATDALMRLRAARLELKALPRTPENAERIAALRREMGEAYEDFEYVVELDPAEFTERVEPGNVVEDEDAAE